MKIDPKRIEGNWNDGYALDKHVVSSTYTGDNEYGHPTFHTVRTEVGEALFQLKYRNDWSQVPALAEELQKACGSFNAVGLIVPMPPSKFRARQPVMELAVELGKLTGLPVRGDILLKRPVATQLKDVASRDEKLTVLKSSFYVNESIVELGRWNALVIDDLYDTGASLESACRALRGYQKIGNIYVTTLTWK